MTSAERARDLAKPPVYVLGAGHRARPHDDQPDARPHHHARRRVGRATRSAWPASSPTTSTCLMGYDSFTITALLHLEDLGFCAKGEGGAFVESGAHRAGRLAADEHQRRRPLVHPPRDVRDVPDHRGGASSCAAKPVSARSTARRSRSRTGRAWCSRACPPPCSARRRRCDDTRERDEAASSSRRSPRRPSRSGTRRASGGCCCSGARVRRAGVVPARGVPAMSRRHPRVAAGVGARRGLRVHGRAPADDADAVRRRALRRRARRARRRAAPA